MSSVIDTLWRVLSLIDWNIEDKTRGYYKNTNYLGIKIITRIERHFLWIIPKLPSCLEDFDGGDEYGQKRFNYIGKGSHCNVVANVNNCDIVVREFELQLNYQVLVRTFTLRKSMNNFNSHLLWVKYLYFCFSRMVRAITYEGWYANKQINEMKYISEKVKYSNRRFIFWFWMELFKKGILCEWRSTK